MDPTHTRAFSRACPEPTKACRRDGWTPQRQLIFLAALASTRSVTAAADAAGMSRESAHRLRNRPGAALFAALWDLALAAAPLTPRQDHNALLGDGSLARLLGNHYRRQSGDFRNIGSPGAERRTR